MATFFIGTSFPAIVCSIKFDLAVVGIIPLVCGLERVTNLFLAEKITQLGETATMKHAELALSAPCWGAKITSESMDTACSGS